ncbi:MAG: pyridoxine/pyridoxamine 5'-phosphate oxidase [Gammaproteobacteria bacterium]|nr:MAG: pyridoxine/pyridoxamine 5'-phosphate oxidase [Gammaproteobacteria bacterium]
MKLEDLRREYTGHGLSRRDLDPDPLQQLRAWLAQAIDAGLVDPTAMVLASVGPDGRPSQRVVLLKDADARGLTFYTNLESRKARELLAHPRASALFPWLGLCRQVSVEGRIEAVPEAEADRYFASRPRDSQLAAWASPQSRPLASRRALDAAFAEQAARFAGRPVPRPPFWGGLRLVPERYEFWQGRENRLHDRFVYEKDGAGRWRIQRLAP